MTNLWMMIFLGVISFSAMIMTITVILVARDVHRMLHRLSRTLPLCDQMLQEAHRTFGEARKVLLRAKSARTQIDLMIHQACLTATDMIERLAGRFRAHNGAGSEPRRRYRGTNVEKREES